MKKKIYLLLSTICLLSITACGKNDKSTENSPSVDSKPQSQEQSPQEIEVSNSYIRYDVTEKNDYPLVGFGAQMDTDIYLPYNKMTKEDEALWEQRIKDMNLKYTRIKYFPEYFERENDNNDPNVFDYNAPGVAPDCAEMLALYKILDLAQKYDIKVDLSLSGCWNFFKSVDGKYNSSWLANSNENVKNYWVTGPTDYYEYAESISAVLKYLIEVKHYTCIWGISNIPESFFNDKGVKDWNEYVEATTIIHEKLIKDGIRDKVKFIGSSEVGYNTAYFREEFGKIV